MTEHNKFAIGDKVQFETRGKGASRTLTGEVLGTANSPARIQVRLDDGTIMSPFRSLTKLV